MPAVDATLLSLLVLGLAGTGHCIGMCGPLLLALPPLRASVWRQVLYHVGRVTTYAAVAGSMGAVGHGLGAASDDLAVVTRIQTLVAVGVSVVMIWLGATRLRLLPEPRWLTDTNLLRFWGLRNLQARLVRSQSGLGAWLLGLLFGLLPCGLSYGAFAAALPSGGFWRGASFGAAFGLGTVPSLLAVGTVGAALFRRHRLWLDLIAGILLVAIGVSFLVDALAMEA